MLHLTATHKPILQPGSLDKRPKRSVDPIELRIFVQNFPNMFSPMVSNEYNKMSTLWLQKHVDIRHFANHVGYGEFSKQWML